MKNCKRFIRWGLLLALLASTLLLAGCSKKEKVIIYTSAEEYRIEYMKMRFTEAFPDYDIVIEYMSTGNQAAKLLAEGKDTECDISYDLEYPYMERLASEGLLADLSAYDTSGFMDYLVQSDFYLPEHVSSAAIIVNPAVLAKLGAQVPTTYADLLKPEYKGYISMPNPKSSGTGYMILKAYVNTFGEAEAFEYFDALSENVLAFTSSGSGPVNALIQEEAAVGLGMTAQAVTSINDGANLEIHLFEEGSPLSVCGLAMVEGKQTRPAVKAVFDFLVEEINPANNELFYPEQLYKDKVVGMDNYPTTQTYSDMSNNSNEEKERLLSLWTH